jgi:predicted RNase H-like HicB family nuclease/DNA-binding XRE family transcriptional regulator
MDYYCRIERDGPLYIASFPDMPNVQTCGETKEEALLNAAEALNGVLSSDVARGILPPAPTYRGRGSHPVEVAPHIIVAIRLRELRGGRSQSEIAQRLGIKYQSYQLLENPNRSNPKIKTLERVARALGKRLTIKIA